MILRSNNNNKLHLRVPNEYKLCLLGRGGESRFKIPHIIARTTANVLAVTAFELAVRELQIGLLL